MGTLYTVIPLDPKCREWLDAEGISYPLTGKTTRYPTPREILEVLHQLPDCTIATHLDPQTREWTTQIEAGDDSWTQIRVRDFRSDDLPHEFYFSKGWPEMVFTVTERLAQRCGAFVVMDDGGSRPVVVTPGADPKHLIRHYGSVEPEEA